MKKIVKLSSVLILLRKGKCLSAFSVCSNLKEHVPMRNLYHLQNLLQIPRSQVLTLHLAILELNVTVLKNPYTLFFSFFPSTPPPLPR